MNNNLIDKSQLGNKETIGSLKTSNNKSCSFSSSNKITLKELLPADYVPRKLDFSKNAIENDKKENPFNKRKLSLNTYNETNTKPLKLKLKKNFICDKTECLNNRNIEFKDFELLSTKKIKTNEHSDDISQFGINHVELQGYQFITIQRREKNLILLVKDVNTHELYSLMVIFNDIYSKEKYESILNELKVYDETTNILVKIEKTWAINNKFFLLLEKIEMEVKNIIIRSFSEKELTVLIKTLAKFSQNLTKRHIFISYNLENMVVTTNNTIKILLTFNEFNIEKLISDNLEALSLSEQNYFYVNLIGKIVFYLITKIIFEESEIKIIGLMEEYSIEFRSFIIRMLSQQVFLDDLITI